MERADDISQALGCVSEPSQGWFGRAVSEPQLLAVGPLSHRVVGRIRWNEVPVKRSASEWIEEPLLKWA